MHYAYFTVEGYFASLLLVSLSMMMNLVAKHLGLCSQWQRSSSRACERLCDLYQNSTNRRRAWGSLWSSSPADVTLVQGFTVRDFSERDFPCEGMDLLVHTHWASGGLNNRLCSYPVAEQLQQLHSSHVRDATLQSPPVTADRSYFLF